MEDQTPNRLSSGSNRAGWAKRKLLRELRPHQAKCVRTRRRDPPAVLNARWFGFRAARWLRSNASMPLWHSRSIHPISPSTSWQRIKGRPNRIKIYTLPQQSELVVAVLTRIQSRSQLYYHMVHGDMGYRYIRNAECWMYLSRASTCSGSFGWEERCCKRYTRVVLIR